MSNSSPNAISRQDPRRWLLAVLILLGVLIFFIFDLQRFLTLEYLQASRDSFAATYFPGGGSDAEDDSNPDFDWASNLIEYALGGYPDNNADAPDQPIMYFDSSNYAVFEITREQIQQDIAYSVWWSQNLTTWTQAGLIVVEDTEMTLKVRTEQTFDQQEKAFFRLQVDR